jgi:hypothetical protein
MEARKSLNYSTLLQHSSTPILQAKKRSNQPSTSKLGKGNTLAFQNEPDSGIFYGSTCKVRED